MRLRDSDEDVPTFDVEHTTKAEKVSKEGIEVHSGRENQEEKKRWRRKRDEEERTLLFLSSFALLIILFLSQTTYMLVALSKFEKDSWVQELDELMSSMVDRKRSRCGKRREEEDTNIRRGEVSSIFPFYHTFSFPSSSPLLLHNYTNIFSFFFFS